MNKIRLSFWSVDQTGRGKRTELGVYTDGESLLAAINSHNKFANDYEGLPHPEIEKLFAGELVHCHDDGVQPYFWWQTIDGGYQGGYCVEIINARASGRKVG